MFKRVIAAILIFVLSIPISMTFAYADGDTTPPELVSITVDKSEVNIGDTLTVTVKATDAVSGINKDECQLDIIGDKFGAADTPDLIGQDTLVFQYCITSNWISGIYHVYGLTLTDNQDNRIYMSIYDGSLPDDHLITVHANDSKTDWTGPVLVSIKTGTRSAKVGDTVTMAVKATDPSGVKSCRMEIVNTTYSWRDYVDLQPVPGMEGSFEGSFKVTADMYGGKYCIMAILTDYCDNISYPASLVDLDVDNPSNIYKQAVPIITDFSMQPSVKTGDTITFTAKINMNGLACNPQNLKTAYLSIYRTVWQDQPEYYSVTLLKIGTNQYSGSFKIPESWPASKMFVSNISFMIGDMLELGTDWAGKFCDSTGSFKGLSFQIQSVFSGTTNASVPVGSTFDPMAGVSACNLSEGGLTSKIIVEGSVDTDTVGLYLIKLKIPSINPGKYYYDFRWIGVTQITPESSAGTGTLVVTSGDVNVGATKNDVSLTKDGHSVSYSSSMSSPGKYSISVKGDGGQNSKAQAGFVIDRVGPAISLTWTGVSPGSIAVSANCKDPSGVSETKWIAGSATLAKAKSDGLVFSKTFNVNRFGYYTIYAKDKLGYESVKVVNVKNILVTKISLNEKSVMLKKGGTCLLKATFAPANATYRNVTWYSRNTAVAVVDANGKVKALKKGTAYIYVKTANGKTARCLVTVR